MFIYKSGLYPFTGSSIFGKHFTNEKYHRLLTVKYHKGSIIRKGIEQNYSLIFYNTYITTRYLSKSSHNDDSFWPMPPGWNDNLICAPQLIYSVYCISNNAIKCHQTHRPLSTTLKRKKKSCNKVIKRLITISNVYGFECFTSLCFVRIWFFWVLSISSECL